MKLFFRKRISEQKGLPYLSEGQKVLLDQLNRKEKILLIERMSALDAINKKGLSPSEKGLEYGQLLQSTRQKSVAVSKALTTYILSIRMAEYAIERFLDSCFLDVTKGIDQEALAKEIAYTILCRILEDGIE